MQGDFIFDNTRSHEIQRVVLADNSVLYRLTFSDGETTVTVEMTEEVASSVLTSLFENLNN